MTSYLFILGRTPALAFLELQSLIPPVRRMTDGVALMESNDPPDPDTLMSTLGGTVKIAVVLETSSDVSKETCMRHLKQEAKNNTITFGLSQYGDSGQDAHSMVVDIKDELEKSGFHARYVEPHEGTELSSVVIAKKEVTDIVIVKENETFTYAKTVAVQPFEQWNLRDRGRPYADPKIGMLPPKVARMIVNIALGGKAAGKTLLDPFCGMGTILAEATLRGCMCYGSDQSDDIVQKAKANIAWLATRYRQVSLGSVGWITSDATHISEHVEEGSIDAVVTEPFMGTTGIGGKGADLSKEKLKNIVRGLEKLYIGCLKDWHKILKPGGLIVMALPEFRVDAASYFVKRVIDTCENLGYTTIHGPLEYGRPNAAVIRKFFVLKANHGTR